MSISVNEIRKDFPLLENRKVIYLDTAATSQKPTCVLEAEREFYENIMPIPCEDYTSWERRQPKIRRSQRDGPGIYQCKRSSGDHLCPQCHGRLKPGGVQLRIAGTETGR